ncbi:hypothetical protein FA132_19735 [Pseudomonas aeruginosa]|nr:hypothetical protein [Pseudomonas aeruginosa]
MIHSLHSAPEWLQAPFLAVAETLELSTPAYYLSAHPAQFSPELVSRIKLVAKHLSKAAGAQRSMALEWVASALQFQNWHQLSTHFSNAPRFIRARTARTVGFAAEARAGAAP